MKGSSLTHFNMKMCVGANTNKTQENKNIEEVQVTKKTHKQHISFGGLKYKNLGFFIEIKRIIPQLYRQQDVARLADGQ